MTMGLVTIFGSMIILFFLLLVTKQVTKKLINKDFCVLCATISLTWIFLLSLSWNGLFDNTILIALLMGSSIVGIYYLVERKVKKEMLLFRLPFFLTLIFIGYLVLPSSSVTSLSTLWKTALLLLALWVLFTISYIYRNSIHIQKKVQKLIECCKRW